MNTKNLQEARPAFSKVAANSPTPSAAPPPLTEDERIERAQAKGRYQARILKECDVATCLNSIVESPKIDPVGSKVYLDTFRQDAGNPTDPIECVLLEQYAIAHHRLARLQAKADASNDLDYLKAYNGAAVRLMGELRRMALSIKQYRTQVLTRSFAVVHQQNIASGSQAVSYGAPSSLEPKETSSGVFDAAASSSRISNDAAIDSNHPDRPPHTRWETEPLEMAAGER